MLVQINEIVVNPGRRNAVPESVRELADSISKLGLLNPITIDSHNVLIAGLHRLEAVKLLHWTEIECSVSSLEGLMAEMAELDENFVRANLTEIEFGEMIMRRKEIYETLHPETKPTSEGGPFRGNQHLEVNDKMSPTTKSFVQDTAEKIGTSKRTVERQLQVAKNLTPEAKEIIRNSDAKLTKKDAMKLSRLDSKQQRDAASQLASGEIRSMEEYPQAATALQKPETDTPRMREDHQQSSLKKIIADLKSHDKDCGYTPDSLLGDIDGMVDRFQRDFAWYSEPHCVAVFSQLSQAQFAFVKQRFASISTAVEDLLHQMERNMQHE